MNWKFWQTPNKLDEPIDKVLDNLRTLDPNSEHYSRNVVFLERLTKLKADARQKTRVSPDTIAIVAGNLLGILIIVAYEQSHAMTSKGLNQVIKPKNP